MLTIKNQKLIRKKDVVKMKKNSIFKYLKNPFRIIPLLGSRGMLNFLPDKIYLPLLYYGWTNKRLDLTNPKTFNEKLQWLKLYDRKPQYTNSVDKYEVRSFIEQKIGKEYLIPLIGIFNSFDEID